MAIDQPKVVKITIVLLFVLSFGLCVSSFVSARECYVTPCFEGDGLDMLWSVDGGQSFQLVCLGLMSFAHVFAAFWVLFRASYDEVKYGMLVACTAVLAAVLLAQAVFWGQQGLMVKDLDEHLNHYSFYEPNAVCDEARNATACKTLEPEGCSWTLWNNCQRTMVVTGSAKAKFDSVTVFSVLLSLTEAAFAYMLLSWKDEFGEIFGGVPSSSATTQPRAAANRASRVSEPAKDLPSAQDYSEEGGSYQADNLRL